MTRFVFGNWVKAASIVCTAVLTLTLLTSPTHASSGWSFTGAIEPPARGKTKVVIKGDLKAPSNRSGIINSGFIENDWHGINGICLIRVGTKEPNSTDVFNDWDPRCKRWSFPSKSNGYYGVAPGSTNYIEWELIAADGPGTYVVKFFDPAIYGMTQTLPGIAPVEIVGELSRTPTTKAEPSTSIVQGDELTLSAVIAVKWTDGVITEVPPVRSSTTLQSRQVGSMTWKTAAEESPHTAIAEESFEARYLIDGQTSQSVLISVITPTSQLRFSSIKANSTRLFKGSPLTLAATMDSQYTDEQWRPTPKQRVKVQFSTKSRGGWVDMGNAWVTKGAVRKNFIPTRSGFWRFSVDAKTSETVFVRILPR